MFLFSMIANLLQCDVMLLIMQTVLKRALDLKAITFSESHVQRVRYAILLNKLFLFNLQSVFPFKDSTPNRLCYSRRGIWQLCFSEVHWAIQKDEYFSHVGGIGQQCKGKKKLLLSTIQNASSICAPNNSSLKELKIG